MTAVDSLTFSLRPFDLLHSTAVAGHFDPHLHSTYCVVVVKAGLAEVWSDRWTETVRAGDVFFFNPYEVHCAVSAIGGTHYESFYPSRAFLARSLGSDPAQGAPCIATNLLSRTDETRELMERLSTTDSEGTTVESLLRRILQACDYRSEPSNSSASAAHAACEVIRNNMNGIRTEDLAEAVGVHKSHLIRAFKKATGIAPQTYIRQIRVAKARELICAGVALAEVAQTLSFSDQSHLTREFKKVFGVPPGVLARSARRDTSA